MLSAKNFHFAYIRLDHSMDNDKLKEQIHTWKDRYSHSNFVLFYSNAGKIMDTETWNERELFGLISNQSSSIAISVKDEFETLSLLLEQYLKMEIAKDNGDCRKIVSTLHYKTIFIDCFVGAGFFAGDYQNTLLAKLIFANSLNQSDFEINVSYYPCGAYYNTETVQFDPVYSINNKPNVEDL
jgi:hypothetical protein